MGAEEWVKEYSDGDEGKKVAIMLGRKPAEMDGEVMDRIHAKIMRGIHTWWQKRKQLLGYTDRTCPQPPHPHAITI